MSSPSRSPVAAAQAGKHKMSDCISPPRFPQGSQQNATQDTSAVPKQRSSQDREERSSTSSRGGESKKSRNRQKEVPFIGKVITLFIFSPICFLYNRLKPRTTWELFKCLLVFRLINAAVIKTAFAPDEQWQSLEIAHKLVYGYGHYTWEWEPCLALRSYLHPLLFAAFYYALEYSLWLINIFLDHVPSAIVILLMQMDATLLKGYFGDAYIVSSSKGIITKIGDLSNNYVNDPHVHGWLIAYGPRLFQAVFTAVSDLAIFLIAVIIFGQIGRGKGSSRSAQNSLLTDVPTEAFWVLAVWMGSWFNLFALCRTYSSCMELTFTLLGVYLFSKSITVMEKPSSTNKKTDAEVKIRTDYVLSPSYLFLGTVFGGIACVFRPTAGIFWTIYGLTFVLVNARDVGQIVCIGIGSLVIVGVVMVQCGLLLDRIFYFYKFGEGSRTVMQCFIEGDWAACSSVPWVVSLYNFFAFNLYSSNIYGSHSLWWYFLDGLGTVLLSFVFPTVYGFYLGWKGRIFSIGESTKAVAKKAEVNAEISKRFLRPLVLAFMVSLVGLSVSAHKEHRLLLPVLFIPLFFCAMGLQSWWHDKNWRAGVIFCFLVQMLVAFLFIFINQQGGDNVMAYLRREIVRQRNLYHQKNKQPQESIDDESKLTTMTGFKTDRKPRKPMPPLSIFFLTPCHAMPMYSYLGIGDDNLGAIHDDGTGLIQRKSAMTIGSGAPAKMAFLDCSPIQSVSSWRDQFIENPTRTMEALFRSKSKSPFAWTPKADFCPLKKPEEGPETGNEKNKSYAKQTDDTMQIVTAQSDTFPYRKLPDYLVISSSVFEHHEKTMLAWLGKHDYLLRTTQFDALFGESFYDFTTYLKYYVFSRKLPILDTESEKPVVWKWGKK